MIDYLVMSAPTLREGIELGARHLPLMHDLAEVVLRDEGELSRILQGPNRQVPMPRAECEFFLACLASICRRALGVQEPFVEVHLPHPAPRDRLLARRLFGASIRYNADCASLSLPSAYLDRGSVTADPHLSRILQEFGALLLMRRPNDDAFKLRVRHLVATTLPNVLALDEAARALGVSARTLRRKLAHFGASYQVVVDDVRHETAARLLHDQGLSMDEVALRVGFTSASTLARAFRRWAGVSPARFRQERKEPADA